MRTESFESSARHNFLRRKVSTRSSASEIPQVKQHSVEFSFLYFGIRYCNTLHPLQFRIGLVHKEFSCVMESKGRKGHCLYNKKWERDTHYKGWVRAFKADKRKAVCQWCDRTIDVSSMGESELKSHSKSEKHKQNSRCEQRVTLSGLGIFELHKG